MGKGGGSGIAASQLFVIVTVERCPKWYWKRSLSEAAHKQVPAAPSSCVTCNTLTGWEKFAENGLSWDEDVEEHISGGNSGAAVRSDQPRIRQSWPAAKRRSCSWSTAMPYIIKTFEFMIKYEDKWRTRLGVYEFMWFSNTRTGDGEVVEEKRRSKVTSCFKVTQLGIQSSGNKNLRRHSSDSWEVLNLVSHWDRERDFGGRQQSGCQITSGCDVSLFACQTFQ